MSTDPSFETLQSLGRKLYVKYNYRNKMSSLDPELNKSFLDLTKGLDLDWDVVVPAGMPLAFDEWRPKDGARIGLNRKWGTALTNSLFEELAIIENDFAALAKPAEPSQEDINHVYATLLLELMQKGVLPVRIGDSLAVEGSAIVLTSAEDGGYEPELLTPDKTLFGDMIGPGYGVHQDAKEEDIFAYVTGRISELPPVQRPGLILVLGNVSLCSAEGYGETDWEAEIALIPLSNQTLRISGAVELQ